MMCEIRTNCLDAYVALLLFFCLVCFVQNQVLSPQAELRFIAPPPDQLGIEELEDARRLLLDQSIQNCWRKPNECAALWISELVDLARAVGCKRIRVDSVSGRVTCSSQQKTIIMTPREFEPTFENEPEKRIKYEQVPIRLISRAETGMETSNHYRQNYQLRQRQRQQQLQQPHYLVSDQEQLAFNARSRALRSGAWLEPIATTATAGEVENTNAARNKTRQVGNEQELGSIDLDGGKVTSIGASLVANLTNSKELKGQQSKSEKPSSSGITHKGIEELTADVPLECEPRFFTYEAHKTDDKGNTCSGLVSASICYGACDTGEIADWLFPHKKSVHKVCMHGSRLRRIAILPDCTEGASYSLREYHYVDAADCTCQKCHSSDTTCLGTPTQPNLI